METFLQLNLLSANGLFYSLLGLAVSEHIRLDWSALHELQLNQLSTNGLSYVLPYFMEAGNRCAFRASCCSEAGLFNHWQVAQLERQLHWLAEAELLQA